MRWKLLRRRLSISAPRMIVRSHLPWPLRWAAMALMVGFAAALAVWAYDVGHRLASPGLPSADEIAALRSEVAALRAERERALSVANTAESLLKAEKTVQERLSQQLRQSETDNLALRADLGFFERLLPVGSGEGIVIRGLQADQQSPGRMRFQLLVLQPGKSVPLFQGRLEVSLTGTLDGKPWSFSRPGGPQSLQVKQYLRIDGIVEHPMAAVVKTVSVKVMDTGGAVKAALTVKL